MALQIPCRAIFVLSGFYLIREIVILIAKVKLFCQ